MLVAHGNGCMSLDRHGYMYLQTHEVEAGCCACLGKVFCSVVLAILLLLVAALSAVAVATGRYQFWTYLQGTDMTPTYVLRCCPVTHCQQSWYPCKPRTSNSG